MIDLSPGRKSLTNRYGVTVPMRALEEAIKRHCDEATAEAILVEYRVAKRRYERASRIERARYYVDYRELPGCEPTTARMRAHLARERELLARAEEYING